MWMMGYNGGSEFNLSNSLDGRKLMPLDPGPISKNNNATSSPHLLSRLHGTDLFAINHHISSMGEQGKRELNNNNAESSVVVSTRWNPTPDQLRSLEDLYQRGTRTPSAEQIQHITAQLRRFGKIEGKNVFYWFQNHKARERQKRRRQLTALYGRDQSSASRTVFEVEQTKNSAPLTNCSTIAEESVPIQRAAIKRGECRSDDDGWVEKGELQHSSSRRLIERNATWQMMQLMSCQPPSCSNSTHQLINSTSTSCTATATETAAIRSRMDRSAATDHLNNYTTPSNIDKEESSIITGGESQTLQLFPIGRINEKETDDETMSSDFITTYTYTPPHQYFEFLPLKN